MEINKETKANRPKQMFLTKATDSVN